MSKDNYQRAEKSSLSLAVMFMLGSVISQSWSWLTVKLIYMVNPDLGAFEIIFLRSIFAMIVLLIYLNKRFKNVAYDSFPSENRIHMAIRIGCGLPRVFAMYSVAKYVNLITLAVVNNATPIFTMLIGVCWLKEKVRFLDVVCIILCLIGAVCMVMAEIEAKGKLDIDEKQQQ